MAVLELQYQRRLPPIHLRLEAAFIVSLAQSARASDPTTVLSKGY